MKPQLCSTTYHVHFFIQDLNSRFALPQVEISILKFFISTVVCKEVHKNSFLDLEPVCCKKRQKIVPDQLLVCGVGDL